MSEIDFVITWVDGSDPKWLKDYDYYNEKLNNKTNNIARYRDWDNLKFWFRSVERFCPWVRKVHFVTYGHYPSWLNLNCEKLNIVYHEDIIPKEYLPTFNSRVIGIYLNRINDLSENFVYLNDDVFINKPIDRNYFFKNSLPNDTLQMFPLTQVGNYNHEGVVKLLCMNIINEKFSKSCFLKKNLFKIFNFRYSGYQNICNLINFPYKKFSYFKNYHLAQPYLKSVFDEVWRDNEQILLRMSSNRFRSMGDVNLTLMRYWALVQGKFNPVDKSKTGMYLGVNNENMSIIHRVVSESLVSEICLNDSEKTDDFIRQKELINNCFLNKFPEKSSFEL